MLTQVAKDGGARQSAGGAAMEANAGLVAGSHNRNELVVIPAEGVCLLVFHPPSLGSDFCDPFCG